MSVEYFEFEQGGNFPTLLKLEILHADYAIMPSKNHLVERTPVYSVTPVKANGNFVNLKSCFH